MRCKYCGVETADPNGYAADDYMYQGHLIQECQEIPRLAREWYNKPWVRGKLYHRLFMRLHRRQPFSLLFTKGGVRGE